MEALTRRLEGLAAERDMERLGQGLRRRRRGSGVSRAEEFY